MAAPATKFRNCFKISKQQINWYPGHMNHSFKHMQAVIRNIDCIVEVHDSRIPFSGRNPVFLNSLIGSKPHILVLNKKDLSDKSYRKIIREKCAENECANVVFTNCLDKNCKGLNRIIPLAVNLIRDETSGPRQSIDFKIMVVGVPNVGKSSVINALRNITLSKGRATPVGAVAGVTKSVMNKIKVSSEPLMYLIDTPGILAPNIKDVETGMKLALCACLNDSVVGLMAEADFLLYWMNKTNNFKYVNYFNLKQPIDEIFPLLLKIAVDKNYIRKSKNIVKNCIESIPNIDMAANFMVTQFRKGQFGDLCFDREYIHI